MTEGREAEAARDRVHRAIRDAQRPLQEPEIPFSESADFRELLEAVLEHASLAVMEVAEDAGQRDGRAHAGRSRSVDEAPVGAHAADERVRGRRGDVNARRPGPSGEFLEQRARGDRTRPALRRRRRAFVVGQRQAVEASARSRVFSAAIVARRCRTRRMPSPRRPPRRQRAPHGAAQNLPAAQVAQVAHVRVRRQQRRPRLRDFLRAARRRPASSPPAQARASGGRTACRGQRQAHRRGTAPESAAARLRARARARRVPASSACVQRVQVAQQRAVRARGRCRPASSAGMMPARSATRVQRARRVLQPLQSVRAWSSRTMRRAWRRAPRRRWWRRRRAAAAGSARPSRRRPRAPAAAAAARCRPAAR